MIDGKSHAEIMSGVMTQAQLPTQIHHNHDTGKFLRPTHKETHRVPWTLDRRNQAQVCP
jgi:hypothetical protein